MWFCDLRMIWIVNGMVISGVYHRSLDARLKVFHVSACCHSDMVPRVGIKRLQQPN